MKRSGRVVILGLALVAALRVLLLAAAFPFFHAVDEHQHVDTIHRWSRGQLPGPETVHIADPVIDWALRFGTFEYLEPDPEPPYYARPAFQPGAPWATLARNAFASVVNQEFESPPVYYATAALWYRLGEIGLRDLDLLLWLRALNALTLALLVLGSHAWLRRRAPDDALLHTGVPALIAFVPQDAFYGVSPDGFCALLGGLAFAMAVEASDGRRRGGGFDVTAGLAVAAAFLAKYTNVVYAGLLGLGYLLRASMHGPAKRVAARAAIAGVAAAVPIGLWLGRNQAVVGDPFATARKVAHLEWTPRAWSQLLEHPVFGAAGAFTWLRETLVHFWRGEFRWLGEPMTWAWLDTTLWTVSLLALLVGAASAWHALRRRDWLEPLALLATIAGFAVLAVLSARFTFADWGNPTRLHPYFVEGRLVLGVLLPFCIVFVRGVALAGARLPAWAPPAALAAWIAFVSVTDWILAAPAFASPWNWLHGG